VRIMDRPLYYKLEGKQTVAVDSVASWSATFRTDEDRIVAQDRHGDTWVSTVFLGMDHNYGDGPPILFETMIFVDKTGKYEAAEYQTRCSTYDEAVDMHATACIKAFG
jgi:hypothetical protein